MSTGEQGRGGREEDRRSVKVVIINTKYVETDAMSFKDVVQKLTGKDSRVAYEVQEPPPPPPPMSTQFSNLMSRDQGLVMNPAAAAGLIMPARSSTSSSSSVMMMRNISFKEFDRLFREMPLPPMDEFWTHDLN